MEDFFSYLQLQPIGNGTSSINPPRESVVRKRVYLTRQVFDRSNVLSPISKKKCCKQIGILKKCSMSNRKQHGGKKKKNQNSSGVSNDTIVGFCSVCYQLGDSNAPHLECKDCNNKAHSHCLETKGGIMKLELDGTWYCPDCKTCIICGVTNFSDVLTVCSICTDAYHTLCHNPQIPMHQQANEYWTCYNCLRAYNVMLKSTTISSLQDYDYSPSHDEMNDPHFRYSQEFLEGPIDPFIPDVTDWTTDDVYDYFKNRLPDSAHVLRNMELDGNAILIARRKDIIQGLGLALGPALKVYRHVVRLQARRDNFSLSWG